MLDTNAMRNIERSLLNYSNNMATIAAQLKAAMDNCSQNMNNDTYSSKAIDKVSEYMILIGKSAELALKMSESVGKKIDAIEESGKN